MGKTKEIEVVNIKDLPPPVQAMYLYVLSIFLAFITGSLGTYLFIVNIATQGIFHRIILYLAFLLAAGLTCYAAIISIKILTLTLGRLRTKLAKAGDSRQNAAPKAFQTKGRKAPKRVRP